MRFVNQGWRYWGAMPSLFFFFLLLLSKKKKGKQRRKKRLSKQKLLKDCHQGQNVTVLAILERLEFKDFSVGHPWWPTVLVSVPWPLHFGNPFRRPCQRIQVCKEPADTTLP